MALAVLAPFWKETYVRNADHGAGCQAFCVVVKLLWTVVVDIEETLDKRTLGSTMRWLQLCDLKLQATTRHSAFLGGKV